MEVFKVLDYPLPRQTTDISSGHPTCLRNNKAEGLGKQEPGQQDTGCTFDLAVTLRFIRATD